MRSKGLLWAAVLAATGLCTHAWGAGNATVSVLVDNDKVKVIHVIEPAGGRMHVDSDDHLVIALNNFRSRETRSGKAEVLQRRRGQAYWRQGGPRSYDMLSSADMIIVDLKPGTTTITK